MPTSSRLLIRRVAAVLLIVSVALLVCMLSLRRIWTADYWWQWKTGQYVAQHGFLRGEPFSFTRADHDRIEVHWGYCLGLYELTEWFGRGAPVVVKCGFVLAMFALMAGIARRRASLVTSAVVVTIAVMASYQRFFTRPEMVSYLLFAAVVAIVERRRRGTTRWIFALPLIEIVWVNVQGLFPLGPAVVGLWLTCELLEHFWNRRQGQPSDAASRRRLIDAAWLTAAMLAAPLVNPYGLRAYGLALTQLHVLHGTSQKGFFQEHTSPFSYGVQFLALTYYEVLIGLTLLSIAINWRRQSLFWVLLIASQLYLSTTAIRNLPLFALVAIPFVVRNVGESPLWSKLRWRWLLPAGRVLAGCGIVALCLFESWQLFTNRFNLRVGDTNQFGVGLAEHRYAVDAVAFLKSTGVNGPIFHTPDIGSVLLANDFRVYIDPRGEVYMDGIIDEFRAIIGDDAKFGEADSRYHFNVVMLPIDGYLPNISTILRRPDWRLVYLDSEAAVLFRAGIAPQVPALNLARDGDAWLTAERARLSPPVDYARAGPLTRLTIPYPYRQLAVACAQLGNRPLARLFMSEAYAAYPPGMRIDDLIALSVLNGEMGDKGLAAKLLVQAADREAGNADLQRRAGLALADADQHALAAVYLNRGLVLRPGDAAMLSSLGSVEINLGHFDSAVAHLEQALRIDPQSADYQRRLGVAHAQAKQWGPAIAAFESAMRLDPNDLKLLSDAAQVYLEKGDLEQARACVNRILAQQPNDAEAKELLTQIEAAGKRNP